MEKKNWKLSLCVFIFPITSVLYMMSYAFGEEIFKNESMLTIADHDALWRDLLIPVCWENPSMADEGQRKWVQDAIEDSWEQVSLVNFTGWGPCTSTSTGIRVRTSFNSNANPDDEPDDWPHAKALGYALNQMEDGVVLNFAVFPSEFAVKMVAVHEFGHALGFAHEQNRWDRFDCEQAPQGTNPTFYITPYDPESVMNYCAPGFASPTQLSDLDVAGIRAVYGPFSDVIPAKFDVVTTINIKDGEVVGHDEYGSRDFPDTFVLTNSVTSDEKRMTLCVGEEVRVEVDLRASLLPGTPFVQLAGTANMYEGESCATDEHESHDHVSTKIGMGSVVYESSEPRLVLHNDDIVDDHADIYVRIQPNVERVVEEAMKNGCSECRDGASRTQFVSGNPYFGILVAIF